MEEITNKEIEETFKNFARSQQADFVLHNRNLFNFRPNRYDGHLVANLKLNPSIQFDFKYEDLLKLLNLDNEYYGTG